MNSNGMRYFLDQWLQFNRRVRWVRTPHDKPRLCRIRRVTPQTITLVMEKRDGSTGDGEFMVTKDDIIGGRADLEKVCQKCCETPGRREFWRCACQPSVGEAA